MIPYESPELPVEWEEHVTQRARTSRSQPVEAEEESGALVPYRRAGPPARQGQRAVVPYRGAKGVINPQASNSPEYSREIDANNLFLEIHFPAPVAFELQQHPFLMGDFWNDLTHKLREHWAMKIATGRMPWAPLKPETIARKAREGVATPEYPMVGTTGTLVRTIRSTAPQEVQTKVTTTGMEFQIIWGPSPGQDQHPSERYRDLFYGSPRDMEESARYGNRGVTPRRPLVLDNEAHDMIQSELQRFVDGIEGDGDPRYCYDERIVTVAAAGDNEESVMPDGIGENSRLQQGASDPQYLITEPQ